MRERDGRRVRAVLAPWAVACGALLCLAAGHARAEDMDLALSRLSQGACERTVDPSATDFQLGAGPAGELSPTLEPDDRAWTQLMTQFAKVALPAVLAPVTTSGPRGFDVALQTSVTGIDGRRDFWKRGTSGHGASAGQTCDGRNRFPAQTLVSNQLSVSKGLPLGLTMGAEVGTIWDTRLWIVGGHLKWALLEGYRTWPVPDLAVRAVASTVLGDPQFSLTTVTLDGILSKNIVLAGTMQVAPYLGGGFAMAFARSGIVDLTPNVDATECAAGKPPCDAIQPELRTVDVAHDQAFKSLSMLRTRGFFGMQARYRLFALAAEFVFDVVPPRKADRSAGGGGLPRQWTFNVAPSLSF